MATVILKLGGSLITDKTRPFSIRYKVLKRLAQELARAYRECCPKIIIVHGGGSFGHHVVSIHGGVGTLESITQTIMFMRELSMIISDIFTLYGLPIVVFDTHALAMLQDDELYMYVNPILRSLDLGLIPLLYGDIVFGNKVRVVSGDEITWYLGNHFDSSRLLFATTVDGVFNKDPSASDAKLLEIVRLSDLSNILFGNVQGVDVTGGMRLKLELAYKYYSDKIKEVLIFNGLVEGRTYEAICGIINRCSKVLRY
jgi:isopentenyl phosphate kinase